MDIKINLSKNGIEQLERQINAYKRLLPRRCKIFVEKLTDVGIKVGENVLGSSEYEDASVVYFYKEVEPVANGCKAILIGANRYNIIEQWVVKQGKEGEQIKQAEVSPILMAEFGSGWGAKNPKGIEGYGQGTFPGQTHAFDVFGWSWKDINGVWHHSDGVDASMPMYNAWMEMHTQITKIAKEVFAYD